MQLIGAIYKLTNGNDYPIVTFVYLGKKIPKYVFLSIMNFKHKFPHLHTTLIHDSDQGALLADKCQIRSFHTKNWMKEEESLMNSLDHPMVFRNGFWFQTLARFFALCEFQTIFNTPVVQIECDVWVGSNFPFKAFANLDKQIAFPMENLLQGSASILWLRDKSGASFLRDYAVRLLSLDSSHTDMTILGKLAQEHPDKVLTLPVSIESKSYDYDETRIISPIFTQNLDKFNGVFDALPYGMYLLGSDPRNGRGWSQRFLQRKEHSIIPEDIKFLLDSKNHLLIESKGESHYLYNLHNHAKRKQLWRQTGILYLLEIIKEQRQFTQPKRKFYFSVFLGLIYQYLNRKVRSVAIKLNRGKI